MLLYIWQEVLNMKILIKFSNEYIQFYDYNDFRNPEYSRTNVLDLQEVVLSDNFVEILYVHALCRTIVLPG